jgi:hypothetical protein
VNNVNQKLGAGLTYDITITAQHGDQEFKGEGTGQTSKAALEAANADLLPDLTKALEEKEKARIRREEEKASQEASQGASFTASWFSISTIGMKEYSKITFVGAVELGEFCKRHMELAKISWPYFVGMDTEGNRKTELRQFVHPHVMQLSAGDYNETVVFRTDSECLKIVEGFFRDPNITIAVFDKPIELMGLGDLFGSGKIDEITKDWMDVQEIAARTWQSAKPSLEHMLTKMLGLHTPLTKFAPSATQLEKEKTYARYEQATPEPLDEDLLLYAGLDAIITKWALLKFHEKGAIIQLWKK